MNKTLRAFSVVQRTLVERRAPYIKPDYSVTSLHLAIDVQEYYLDCLNSERKKSFPLSIREFADSLFPIPALCVAFKRFDNFHINSGILLTTLRGKVDAIEMFGLEAVGIREEESIFSKSGQSAFADEQLGLYLKQQYPNLKNLIVTGLRTPQCVASTIAGGIENGYFCFAIYDKMAHTHLMPNEGEPLNHRWLLEKRLEKLGCKTGYEITESKSFLAHLAEKAKRKPAEPSKQPPVSQTHNKRFG